MLHNKRDVIDAVDAPITDGAFRLLVLMATKYAKKNPQQQEIADQMGVTRATIWNRRKELKRAGLA